MSEVIEKIKSFLSIKGVVIIVLLLGVVLYLIYSFKDENTTEEKESKELVITKNDKPKTREYFETINETKTLASNGIMNDRKTDEYIKDASAKIEDYTDDEELILLNKTRQQILEKENKSAKIYTKEEHKKIETSNIKENKDLKTSAVSSDENIKPTKEDNTTELNKKKNKFFEGKRKEISGNTVSCAVHGEQTVMNGSTIKLRLLDDYNTVQGIVVPKGSTLWGTCSMTNERMNVYIENVIINKDLIPLNLEVYDIDGLKGINLPNSVKAEIASRTKQEAINQTNSQDIIGNSNIVERGANSAVNAVKSVLSKNERQIKVLVKSNYNLILKR